MITNKKENRSIIKNIISTAPKRDDMWTVAIAYKNKLGFIEYTYGLFSRRYDAEKWLSDFVKDGRPYYASCCDNNTWHDVNELLCSFGLLEE